MLKRMILAALATAFVAAFALPVQIAPAAAEGMSCKQAAKAKYAGRPEGAPRLQEGVQNCL